MIREYIIKISDEIMEEEIADMPQELVRCKDCRKHGDIACPLWTDAVECETDDNWFCADGEKRPDL